jgi:hypothetical protein
MDCLGVENLENAARRQSGAGFTGLHDEINNYVAIQPRSITVK